MGAFGFFPRAAAGFDFSPFSGRGFLLPQLFMNTRLVPTLLLWIMFFMNMLDIYFLNSWLPTLTHGVGLDVQAAISIGIAFQLGGMLGTIGLGLLIQRLGFHRVLFLTYIAGFVSIVTIGLAGAWLPNGIVLLVTLIWFYRMSKQ